MSFIYSLNNNLAHTENSGDNWYTQSSNGTITLFLAGTDIAIAGGWSISLTHSVHAPCLLLNKSTGQIYLGLLTWTKNSNNPASSIMTFLLLKEDGSSREFVTSGYKVYCALPPVKIK